MMLGFGSKKYRMQNLFFHGENLIEITSVKLLMLTSTVMFISDLKC
jgi:hypothetical protein